MSIQFTSKGKIFSDIVFKDSIPATIQTERCRIYGTVYMHRQNRLIDELNHSDPFIAVTDATIFKDNGEILYKSDFVTINRDHIIWLLPHEEGDESQLQEAED
ncbi:MAG TPA: hypothetical protein VE136_12280 [Anaerolineales bacterium]|jgi:hypothetical protein|nr:hypothetical protein [Anaerolineales bacterium]